MSTKRKLDVKVAKPAIKHSAKSLEKQRVNESQAIVTSGGGSLPNVQAEIVEISSAEEEEEEEESSEDEDQGAEDISMADAASENEEAEPSFGDLVRINASEPIDVAGAFDDPSNAVTKSTNGTQNIQRLGASLGTVLAQALKTNDESLLEQCLNETDLQTVRLTLQRLASPLAATLLRHLASKLHRRPGRAGSLIVWIQWALVTHGGYLATQQGICKELEDLHRVVDERSRGLQPLLMLKGKLDMLEAQIKLRKSMQNSQRNLDDEEDEEAVIYVEGEESDEDEDEVESRSNGRVANGVADSDADSEVSDDMPNTNGVIADSDADSEDDSEGGLIIDEAEETDADSEDEDEIDFDDQDELEEEEDSEDEKDAAPPSKLQKVGNIFSRKR